MIFTITEKPYPQFMNLILLSRWKNITNFEPTLTKKWSEKGSASDKTFKTSKRRPQLQNDLLFLCLKYTITLFSFTFSSHGSLNETSSISPHSWKNFNTSSFVVFSGNPLANMLLHSGALSIITCTRSRGLSLAALRMSAKPETNKWFIYLQIIHWT